MDWIISTNEKKFDHVKAFRDYGFIDWWQRNYKFREGDAVYIYVARPWQRIMFKTVVEKVGLSFQETVDNSVYWRDKGEYIKALSGRFVRLKLVGEKDSDKLSLSNLRQYGLKTAPQSVVKLSGKKQLLAGYLNDYMDCSDELFPEIIDAEKEDVWEGASVPVRVNRYERSAYAREKCIEVHGYSCAVCGMDFSKTYGSLGAGFIHVHHIVPLNEIGENYKVNPATDLVPVCPNCHAMLHRSYKGRHLSVEELRGLITEYTRP